MAAWLALSGCSETDATGGDEPTGPDTKGPDQGEGKGMAPAPSGNGPKVIEAPPMNVAANDAQSRAPMDAAPTADGSRVYYTALGKADDGSDVAGIFTVAGEGGAIETLALGAPLMAPVGISVSPDGAQVFVADAGWYAGEASLGAIAVMPSSGGTPAALAGTEGYLPRGLVIADVSDETWLYFTGNEPSTGAAGVFRTTLGGGAVMKVASGEPFVEPAGVAVASDGTVYVIDAAAGGGDSAASLIRVRKGEAEHLVDGLGVGFPAGVATTLDASTVLVSGLDPVSRTDRVFLVDAKSGQLSAVIEEPFSSFSAPAGLHRAHDTNTFAWADSAAGRKGEGTVYRIQL